MELQKAIEILTLTIHDNKPYFDQDQQDALKLATCALAWLTGVQLTERSAFYRFVNRTALPFPATISLNSLFPHGSVRT